MARAATDRLKLNPPLGRMPVLQFCAPGELQVDPTYQRGLETEGSKSLVRRIAQHWNWDLCQPLVVARREGGGLFVIDGQHRLAAAQRRGDLAQLPCVVVDHANVADEAASFVHLNQQRKPLTRLDLFRAAVASGDTQACAIIAALEDAGLVIAPHENYVSWKPGMVSHIGGIQRTWQRGGQVVAERSLVALGLGFQGQIQRYCGTLYRGISRVVTDEVREHGSFNGDRFERFVQLLQGRTQIEWMAAINRYFADNPDMFRAEAAESLLRDEWRRALRPAEAIVKRQLSPGRNLGEPTVARREGFGLGAGDWKGDEEWTWCSQCDARRTKTQALACQSKFCAVKVVS